MHQEHTFRHRSAGRTPAESGQEYLTSGQECIEPCKIQWGKGTGAGLGETRVLVGLDLPLDGGLGGD